MSLINPTTFATASMLLASATRRASSPRRKVTTSGRDGEMALARTMPLPANLPKPPPPPALVREYR